MDNKICIVGNRADIDYIRPIADLLEEKGYAVEIVFPQSDKTSWHGALEDKDAIICITPQCGNYVYQISQERKEHDLTSINLYLEHTLHNPEQRRALKGNKSVEAAVEPSETVAELENLLTVSKVPKEHLSEKVENVRENDNKSNEDVSFPPMPEHEMSHGHQTTSQTYLSEESTHSDFNRSEHTVHQTDHEDYESPQPKKRNTGVIIFIIALILCAGGIFWWFYYANVYLPAKIDREAERTYPMVNVFLRSSKMAGGDFNKITSVPASSELITYEKDGEWAKVKYIPVGDDSKPIEGYVASDYLLNKRDLYNLTSMLADDNVRETLATSKVRRGLLNYYNSKGIAGRISAENAQEAGLPYNPSDQWQIIFHKGQAKPNEAFFKRVYNPDSKFTDLAVIIENVATGAKKVLYFTYDDNETPHLRGEADYYNGAIKDMRMNTNGNLEIIDKNGYITYVPVY